MMRNSRVSVFQQDVSDVVAALQIEHQMEYLAQDGLFSVDVAILRAGRSIAIEVDGPYHYTLNTHQPLGHTLLRYVVHLAPQVKLQVSTHVMLRWHLGL